MLAESVEDISREVNEAKQRFVVTKPQKPDYVFTAQRLAVDEELKILVQEAQSALGKTLSNSDTSTLLMLKDTCGLHLDVILMLIHYCISIDKGNMRTVEKIGVERAVERTNTASLILAVFDSSAPLDSDDRLLIEKIRDKNVLVILNKSDLHKKISKEDFEGFAVIELSAKDGTGEEELIGAIEKAVGINRLSPDDTVLLTERQRSCAARALSNVKEALSSYNAGVTLDAVGVLVDDGIEALLELTGERVVNEVADEVFKSFCIGK